MKKNIISKINKRLAIFTGTLLLMFPSCSLDEDVYSLYTPETYYENETQVLSTLSGIYRNFARICSMGQAYRIMEVSTDEQNVLGRINGWWQNTTFLELMEHTWTADNSYIDSGWDTFFEIVGQTNALIASLEKSDLDVEDVIAELQALRAYAYFFLMDLYGNVPIFTNAKVEATDLPEQNTRTEVFDFVVSELSDAAQILPSQTDIGSEYYGRFTKEAMYALLATIYLNGEVYTGTAYYSEAITYADLVINSGAFSLLPDYFDNFVYDNEENAEMIFTGVFTPNSTGGIGHPFVQKTLPSISGGLFDLPYSPQNGFGTTEAIYNLYEDEDVRKEMFFPYGPMINPNNGDTVMVESVVTDGTSALYVEGESTEGPVPYVITEPTGLQNQSMTAGIKWIKWGLDPETNGGSAGNDVAFLRYADILLIKAEALIRNGSTSDEALSLVNQVRERSNASTLTSIEFDDILDERGRELAFEMTRRRDLIRFDKFTAAWQFKEESEDFRNLYPIPRAARDANPNLEQNPGYSD